MTATFALAVGVSFLATITAPFFGIGVLMLAELVVFGNVKGSDGPSTR